MRPCPNGTGHCLQNADCQGDLKCFIRNFGEMRPGYDFSQVSANTNICVTMEKSNFFCLLRLMSE